MPSAKMLFNISDDLCDEMAVATTLRSKTSCKSWFLEPLIIMVNSSSTSSVIISFLAFTVASPKAFELASLAVEGFFAKKSGHGSSILNGDEIGSTKLWVLVVGI